MSNHSFLVTEFIFAGFSERPQLRMLLFVLVFSMYAMSLAGNTIITTVIRLNPVLHIPMYFFLTNLSLLEICYTTTIVPKMLASLMSEHRKKIALWGCATQMYFFTLFGITECCLLAAMAYDRYVAICNPLRYTIIMSPTVCVQLSIVSWSVGLMVGLGQANYVFSLTFCGPNRINHFFCDIPPLLTLACGDTSRNVIAVYMVAVLFITTPFLLILTSYVYIVISVLKIPSAEGRQRAFSTCSSHLIVVSLFYGSGIITYLRPKSSYSAESDKLLALFYTVVTSMLNPIIYSLRNKEVKVALRRMMGNKLCSGEDQK
ncbi:olfactory receptor 10AG1-like [Crotalus tigris]|uniref:olfactory receptor 10AG1-like n=1 Tax=Crotalus tigris TaxID=88082 RepID=UPI00192F372C|nr:olfactory receptor 10AG1-like [Crotalus tigris]XP_039186446.1 olfactory receptor 10AG1-like [Crotalus tigris]XP_039186447.1 olfactory receptor 10AG1-like [Crotalus tigris]XP_039186448.1 olfactory receptor 10AG1-like [Crotalus tigris]XP_039186449.1 olfactory receptor 10AG1-like [Crotalus tigris]XP_039186450.1 olfactory receptor 10AG1-like [Crotalus tigris]